MEKLGPVTLEHVKQALGELGGEAPWVEILAQLDKNRKNHYSPYKHRKSYRNTARQVIHTHCPDYPAKYRGSTYFKKLQNGSFLLIENEADDHHSSPGPTPIASDIRDHDHPQRVNQETYRILRDTRLARMIKARRRYQCQICGIRFEIGDGKPYAEAHHIKPLGAPHNGPDVIENILCVCPNDHVLLDYGAIKLEKVQLEGIGSEYVDYHNGQIFGKC